MDDVTRSLLSPEEQAVKRRAACDECRQKKLKCTGEQPACSRCMREKITCVYSPQKPMGRPKKRLRNDEQGSSHDETSIHGLSSASRPVHSTTDTADGGGARNSQDISLDQATVDSVFTPGGNFQPWVHQPEEWAGLVNNDTTLPDLTSDTSSQSPPLHAQSCSGHNSNGHMTPEGFPDNSTHLLLQPGVSGDIPGIPTVLPNCACLSSMYLTLNRLQSMDPSFTFPFALHPLREAMLTAFNVLSCEHCPRSFLTGIQNTNMVGTLIVSIAERFSKVLAHITLEAKRAEVAGESKKFRLADLNTSTSHLHTNGIGCVAAFSLNLNPSEWRMMSKKVVRAEVYGPEEGNECCSYLMGIIKQMEERQERWHRRPFPEDQPKDFRGVPVGAPLPYLHKKDWLCLKLVGYASILADGFDWS